MIDTDEIRTCEFCRWESEDMEGTHCRHCIHNATDNFEHMVDEENVLVEKALNDFSIRIVRDLDRLRLYHKSLYLEAKRKGNITEEKIHLCAKECFELAINIVKRGGRE